MVFSGGSPYSVFCRGPVLVFGVFCRGHMVFSAGGGAEFEVTSLR